MKKLLIGAAGIAALSLSLTVAPAIAAPNFSQVCKDGLEDLVGYSHGECTSVLNGFYNKGKGNNDVSAFCRDIRAGAPDFFDAAFKNLGDCIKQLGPYFPG